MAAVSLPWNAPDGAHSSVSPPQLAALHRLLRCALPFCPSSSHPQVPERFVARRPAVSGPGWEVLVRWSMLGYDMATWEPEGEGLVIAKEHAGLMESLWTRQRCAAQRATPEALAVEAELRPEPDSLPELEEQPAWVGPGMLKPHQLDAVNWLRKNWAAGRCGIVADEPGLGRTAAVVTFLKVRQPTRCRQEVKMIGTASKT